MYVRCETQNDYDHLLPYLANYWPGVEWDREVGKNGHLVVEIHDDALSRRQRAMLKECLDNEFEVDISDGGGILLMKTNYFHVTWRTSFLSICLDGCLTSNLDRLISYGLRRLFQNNHFFWPQHHSPNLAVLSPSHSGFIVISVTSQRVFCRNRSQFMASAIPFGRMVTKDGVASVKLKKTA